MPFLLGNFDVNRNLVKKTSNFGMVCQENFCPPPYPPVANISVGNFFGAFFNIQKCPWNLVPPPPQSFDASYAPVNTDLRHCADNTYVHYHHCSSNMPSNPVSSPSNSSNRPSPLSTSGKSFSSVFRSGE